jgi:hypothetical protein
MSYTLAFYRAGESDPAHSIGPTRNREHTVELEPGFWDIEVTAYYGAADNDTAKTAAARENGQEILAGQENTISFEMIADNFITPNMIEGDIQELSFTTGDTPPPLSVTMHTSTGFSGIAGWTDRFSYQWYYEDADGNKKNVGSSGSFSASRFESENLRCPVTTGAAGTFSYWVKIANSYTYTPPGGGASTSGSVEKSIQVAEVTVNQLVINPGLATIYINWPENYLPESITGNMSYVLEFYKTSDHLSDPRTQEKTITRELPPGNWDIVATAYYGDGAEPAALGKEPQVEIRAGETISVSVTMDADHYIMPSRAGAWPWPDQDQLITTSDFPTLSITMNTSTAFSSIPGWTDNFSYQWYYIDNMTEARMDVGAPGSFSAFPPGLENLSWTVNPSVSGLGTFSYYVDITNTYTPTPTSTQGSVTNFIYVAKVEVVSVTYSVNDPGPGGGTVFYKSPGGFISGGVLCHYLEVGSTDLGPAEWGANGSVIPGARGTEIGTGYDNTQAILAVLATLGESGKAAQLAATHSEPSYPGFTDWFLPSRRELSRLYALLILSGSFHSRWSSTETDADGAEWIYRSNNIVSYGHDPKTNTLTFRPIRAF